MNETFGQFVKRLRANTYSQRTMAAIMEVNVTFLNKIENDAFTSNPAIETVQKIERALQLKGADRDTLYLLAKRLPQEVTDYLDTPAKLERVRKMIRKDGKTP
jgi:HTH-type transcriptional regulator, competence development regulator